GGGRLAVLRPGAGVTPGSPAAGGWREATVTGWVPVTALRRVGEGNYPLAVQGERALHASPRGPEIATLGAGMVVAELERRDGWVHIRRAGFVRDAGAPATPPTASGPTTAARPSVPQRQAAQAPAPRLLGTPAAGTANRPVAASAPQSVPPASPVVRRIATPPAVARARVPAPSNAPSRPAASPVHLPAGVVRPSAPPAKPASAPAVARSPAAAAGPGARALAGARTPVRTVAVSTAAPARKQPLVLHASRTSGTMAVVDADAPVEVLARDGEWTRVRVEGWTRTPVAGTAAEAAGGVTLDAIRADPDAFRGRDVEWTLRFVSLQAADAIRTDFTPGEPFILARDPNGETGFVYVAVPPDQLAAARRLAAFQQFRISGRVRTGRSPLVGHPIIDLVRLR
ncbi:MAG: hypothetical protein JWM27_739, partial [Gemmatimonadetes bacterium]|nr:hypothetical protein [Gemmatimonadota bacterium]